MQLGAKHRRWGDCLNSRAQKENVHTRRDHKLMFRNPTYLPFLGDTITCLILLEIGKQKLIRQGNEVVTTNKHQDLLDEASCVA